MFARELSRAEGRKEGRNRKEEEERGEGRGGNVVVICISYSLNTSPGGAQTGSGEVMGACTNDVC